MFAIEMQHITKRFGDILANNNVNFSVEKGSIHALVGENGAGKSTLMNILYGMHIPDSGNIIINGIQQQIAKPSKAIALGIGMVHQHFMLIPPLTIAENVILGKEPTHTFGVLDLGKAEKIIRQLSDKYKIIVNPKAKIESLSVGLQQRVEILKILYRDAEILILDEPTAVLTPLEVEELFATLRYLKEQGKTTILISHKLTEIMAISDKVTVMRHGKTVAEVESKSTSKLELARLMVDKDIIFTPIKNNLPKAKTILEVKNISAVNDCGLTALRNISFTINAGEILGVAAVEGNGQSELIQVLSGLRKPIEGKVSIQGRDLFKEFKKTKIAHIPEDRLKRGLISSFSLTDNFILGRQFEKQFSNFVSLNHQQMDHYSEQLIQQYDVRPPDKKLFAHGLSGGNQQKVVIARELSKNADIIIASQPTRGLDIGAIEFVHKAIMDERNNGKATLLVSSDLTELLTLSDRIAVMYEGKIVAILDPQNISERDLGAYMTGVKGLAV
jgi:general nucleoside transport system ATP-binding protein